MKNPTYLIAVLFLISSSSCVNEGLQEAIDEVKGCADFNKIEATEINISTDTTYLTGKINEHNFGIKPGFKDYIVNLNQSYLFSTSGSSTGGTQSPGNVQLSLSFIQGSALSGSFYGNPLFGADLEFPCAEDADRASLLQKLNGYESGTVLPIRSRGKNCDEGVSISLKAFCFSGLGYTTTPLTTEGGSQLNNFFEIDTIEVIESEDGEVTVNLQAHFTADLYFMTPAGGPIHYGKISDGKVGLFERIE